MTGVARVEALVGSALFQDAGRRHVASGVPVGGAFDRFAHEAATRLVAGTPADAALEVAGTLVLSTPGRLTCALAGSASLRVDGRAAPVWTALDVPAGSRIEVAATGRGYLAITGGLHPKPVLGSRSTCLMGPVGPAPIRAGDALPLGPIRTADTVGDVVAPPPPTDELRVVPGPHHPLTAGPVTVVDVSRIGIRLRPAGAVAAGASLPSLGVLPGAIQVLPSGDWVVLGPDAGTMGGYPIIGVVVSVDVGRLAHVVPGQVLTLRPVAAGDAPRPVAPRILRLGALRG